MIWTIALVMLAAAATFAGVYVSPEAHIGIAALSALTLAAAGVVENRRLASAGASKNALSAATGRHMASVWGWGGVSLLAIYLLTSIRWPEWWQFALAFAALTLLTAGFAAMSARDAALGREDAAMQKLGRRLTWVQFAGMFVVMAGLLIDGKMHRFLDIRKGWEDWPANNVFFFGALAIAVISANALWTSRNRAPQDALAR